MAWCKSGMAARASRHTCFSAWRLLVDNPAGACTTTSACIRSSNASTSPRSPAFSHRLVTHCRAMPPVSSPMTDHVARRKHAGRHSSAPMPQRMRDGRSGQRRIAAMSALSCVTPPPAGLGYMPLGTGPAAPARAPTNSQCAPPLRFGSERRRYAGPRRRSRNERGRCCNEWRYRRWVHAFGGIRSRHSGAAVSGGLCRALAFDPPWVGPCCPPARLGPGDAPPLSANLSGGAPVRAADSPLGYHDHAQVRLRATPPCRSEPLEILPPRRHGGTGHSGSRRSCVRPNRSSVCARLPIAPPQVFRRPDSAPRGPSGALLRRIHVGRAGGRRAQRNCATSSG